MCRPHPSPSSAVAALHLLPAYTPLAPFLLRSECNNPHLHPPPPHTPTHAQEVHVLDVSCLMCNLCLLTCQQCMYADAPVGVSKKGRFMALATRSRAAPVGMERATPWEDNTTHQDTTPQHSRVGEEGRGKDGQTEGRKKGREARRKEGRTDGRRIGFLHMRMGWRHLECFSLCICPYP